MARLGVRKSSTPVTHAAETVNKAGGVAFTIPEPSKRLLHLVGQMFGEPTYYPDSAEDAPASGLTSEAQAVIDTATACASGPEWEYLLPIAWYAREELRMRSTPTVLFAIAAECLPKNKAVTATGLLRLYGPHILQRADEPRNALAAWLAVKGVKQGSKRTVPNGLRRAIRDRLRALPEHLLAKYDHPVRPSMGDTIRLCARDLIGTPKIDYFVNPERWAEKKAETPVLAAKAALHACTSFDDTARAHAVAAHATWEEIVSKFGSKKEVWEFCVGQMGYMAKLRNLRNFIQAGVDLTPVLATIADPAEVVRSKQLPFRFLSAADAVKDTPGLAQQAVGNALAKAMDAACAALPRLPGVTAIFVDHSGSMGATLSGKSKMTMRAAASILSAMMAKVSDEPACFSFSTDVKFAPIQAGDSVLSIANALSAITDPRTTNAHLCPPALRAAGIRADRIVLFSDMQCWDSFDPVYGGGGENFREAVRQYRSWAGKQTWVHTVNLAGTVQAQMASDDPRTNLLSGFSEKVIDTIARSEGLSAESGRTVLALDDIRTRYGVDAARSAGGAHKA